MNDALKYALKLLGRKSYSRGKLKQKLRKKEFEIDEIKEAIEFLEEKKFIDDALYAEGLLKSRLHTRPQGKLKIRELLKRHLLDEEIINLSIGKIKDSSERAMANLAKTRWVKLNGSYQSDLKKKEKLMRHLLGQGFSYEIIKELV